MDQAAHCWRFVAQSVTGPSHVGEGTPCQDSHAVCVLGSGDEAVLVACVADGAGSASRSDEGSRLACEAILASAADHAERDPAFEALDEQTVLFWLTEARQRLVMRADDFGCDVNDFATTICLAIVGPRQAAFVQVGDGAMVVSKAGVHGVVIWPQSGEYANTTNFITRASFTKKVEFVVAPGRFDEIALMTDGLERLALQFDMRAPHVPFFTPLFRAIADREPGPALDAELAAFLRSPSVTSRSNDDKTLILAARQQ